MEIAGLNYLNTPDKLSNYLKETYRAEDVSAADDLALSEVGRSKLPLLVQVQGRNVHSTKQ